MKIEAVHFYNCENLGDVYKIIDSFGGFNYLYEHSIGAFYSHSNYVELWYNLSAQGKAQFNNEIPAFQELEMNWNTIFGNEVQSKLWTTAWPNEIDKNRAHDDYSKDKPLAGRIDKFGNDRCYNPAPEAFKKSLKIKNESLGDVASEKVVYKSDDYQIGWVSVNGTTTYFLIP